MSEQNQHIWPRKIMKSLINTFIDGVFDDLIEKEVLNQKEATHLAKQFATVMDQSQDFVDTFDHLIKASQSIMQKLLFPHLQVNSKTQREEKALVLLKNSDTVNPLLSVLQTICNSSISCQVFQRRLRNTILNFFEKFESNVKWTVEHPKNIKLCRPDFYNALKEAKEGEIYSIMEKGNRKRIALIICNISFDFLEERYGAQMDIWGMWELLENLGYSVTIKTNLTAQEMESALKEFAGRSEHAFSDSTFLVFMSHGLLNGICGKKHSKKEPDILATDTIFKIFNDGSCPSLQGKPKVIITQACRGEELGITYLMEDTSNTSIYKAEQQLFQDSPWSNSLERKHIEKDFILFCSSTPRGQELQFGRVPIHWKMAEQIVICDCDGMLLCYKHNDKDYFRKKPDNISWRTDEMGSIFIKELIFSFQQYAWCCHLEEIFRKVQKSFEIPKNLVQMPTIERGSMSRYFYLFPGI